MAAPDSDGLEPPEMRPCGAMPTTPCPDCDAVLPVSDGPTHAYIGASAACWGVWTRMTAGEPPVAPTAFGPLITDAYAAQHPGGDSRRATQSVAVHLLTLCQVLVGGSRPTRAVTLRTHAVEKGRSVGAWELLRPRPEWELTIHDVVERATPSGRAALVEPYVRSVWTAWYGLHGTTIDRWMERLRN